VLTVSEHADTAADVHAPPGTPVISAVADPSTADDRYRFALYPGVVERIRLLARYAMARDSSPQPRFVMLYPDHTTPRALLDAAIAAVPAPALVEPVAVSAARVDEVADAMRTSAIDNVLVLGADEAVEAVVAKAHRRGWHPRFHWSDPPRHGIEGVHAVTVQPALASDITAEAGASYARCVDLATTNALDRRRHLALLAAARLLVTALEQAGRDVGRERLVESLQSLREFRSGFAPPGSLTPRRHTAASGMYVAPLPASGFQGDPVWMMLD
jgi:hypothetical protein